MTKKILVVDDEADTRTYIKTSLEDAGYKVSTAKNGDECLAILKKKKFDLVLLDHFMPGMSGRQLAEKIREDPKLKDTKFAFLTVAEFGIGGVNELKKLGSLDYIKKPVDNEELIKRIRKIV